MSDPIELIELQRRQKEHDENHHYDIHTLPYYERMDHYVLHFSKYVGRLSKDYPTDNQLEQQVHKTAADTFIVTLAAANTLNLDLQANLEEMFGEGIASNFDEWQDAIDDTDGEMDLEEVKEWLMVELAEPTGEMANALESIDHMEGMNAREILTEGTLEIFIALVTASNHLNEDMIGLVEDRWETIESESIL